MKKYRLLYKFVLIIFVFVQCSYVFFFKAEHVIDSAGITTASVTLSNPRLSYKAQVSSATSGGSSVTVTSGSADSNTNHLFPNDSICIANDVESGCRGTSNSAVFSQTYVVSNVANSTTFAVNTPLAVSGTNSDFVVATQSGTMTFNFVTGADIPSSGNILLTIPAVNGTSNAKTSDGFPDTAASTTSNGFDFGIPGSSPSTLSTSDVSVTSGCTPGNWSVNSVTLGTTTTDHMIQINRSTSTCSAGATLTIVVGTANHPVINPAPVTSHTVGQADVYQVNIQTRSGSTTIESRDVTVAPVEGVLVSATVDETLSFTVAGVASSTSVCGQTTDIGTTAFAVPWGTLTASNTFQEAAQQLTVSTNAPSGYTVKMEENDQMGKDGTVCTGSTAGESVSCIKDTTCDSGSCSESSSADWAVPSNNGLGFSMANSSGTDAAFSYNESGRTFSTRQIADMEASETKQTIMSNTGAVSGKSSYVCYRLSISGTQPPGYYYNKVKYTATAVF